MEKFIAGCLRLRTVIVAVGALVLAGGIWQTLRVPLDVVPEFSPLSLQVRTEALGLSAAEVESLITVPLEADLLIGVPWLKSMDSESITGVSSIDMLFEPGTDLSRARQMVNERMTQARALPNVSLPPTLLPSVSTANRIMNIGMSSASVSLIDMSTLAQWTIVPRLTGIAGVANVSIWGQRNRQVQVLVDPERLHQKGIKLDQMVKTAGEAVWASPLTYLNSSTPGTGGFIDTPNQRLSVRHVFPIQAAADFANIPVVGTSIAIHDVADVVEANQPLIGDAITKDGPGLMLVVEKYPGFNTLEVTRRVEAALDELRPGMSGIDIDTTIYRPAGFIERAARNLSTVALIAAVLALISIGAFLRDWRATLVAAVSVALSIFAALLVLYVRGQDVNMMVVAGLMAAIAVVVDDAIVDSDTIRRRLSEARHADPSRPLWQIVAGASVEVRGPMLYATLICVVAAVPLLLVPGLSAAFFRPLAWSYILAVVASLVVAMTVAPALNMLLSWHAATSPPAAAVRTPGPVQQRLAKLAEAMLRAPSLAYGLAAGAVVVGALIWLLQERSFIPSFKETDVFVEVQARPGTSVIAMDRMTTKLIHDLRGVPGVRNAAAQVGRALLSHDVMDVNSGEVWVSLDPKADYEGTLAAMRTVVAAQSGITGEVQTYLSKQMRERLTGEDIAISVRVFGQDLGILRQKAQQIRDTLATIPGIKNPEIEQQAEQQEIQIEVDLERARAYGLKPGDVRRNASALIGGITVGNLFQEGKVFDVVVWGRPELRKDLNEIRNLLIDTESGAQVRLAEVARVDSVPAPSVIHRQGVSRRIDVEAAVSGRSVAAATEEVRRQLKEVSFPYEYHAEVLGEYVERKAAMESLYSYMIAAAIMIVLLLQAALGSWRCSLLVIMGLPVAALGGLVAAVVAGGTLSLGSFLGLVVVGGLAMRNGTMLLARVRDLARQSTGGNGNLVLKAAAERAPAVFATAATIALVVLPLVVAGNIAGLEILHPAAVVILGGLVTATISTLVFLPALYPRWSPKHADDAHDVLLDAA
jgi:Cu/Ag efflux pump CusA